MSKREGGGVKSGEFEITQKTLLLVHQVCSKFCSSLMFLFSLSLSLFVIVPFFKTICVIVGCYFDIITIWVKLLILFSCALSELKEIDMYCS